MEINFFKKIQSRRFIVFSIWTILIGLDTIMNKKINTEILQWYGLISLLYISSSVAKSWIYGKKDLSK